MRDYPDAASKAADVGAMILRTLGLVLLILSIPKVTGGMAQFALIMDSQSDWVTRRFVIFSAFVPMLLTLLIAAGLVIYPHKISRLIYDPIELSPSDVGQLARPICEIIVRALGLYLIFRAIPGIADAAAFLLRSAELHSDNMNYVITRENSRTELFISLTVHVAQLCFGFWVTWGNHTIARLAMAGSDVEEMTGAEND